MPKGFKESGACGTVSGYHGHRRRGEVTCRACRDANNARNAEYRAARRPIAEPKPTVTIAIHCPACQSSVESINRRSMGGEVVALVRCESQRCGREFLVRAYVAPATRDADGEYSRCGTEAGAQRHYRRGEKPCDACLMAHADKAGGRDKRKKAAA